MGRLQEVKRVSVGESEVAKEQSGSQTASRGGVMGIGKEGG